MNDELPSIQTKVGRIIVIKSCGKLILTYTHCCVWMGNRDVLTIGGY